MQAAACGSLAAHAMTQRWDPDTYAAHARFVSELGAPVADLLAPQPGERVLDVGCGDGALTERFRAAGCVVVAIDSSPEQVWAALERGLDARIIDARELEFQMEFDAVFSNAVLHWIGDAERVIVGVWRALKPGGRFVGEFGGHGCVASIREAFAEALGARDIDVATVDPWYFPTAAQYRSQLESRGFSVDSIQLFPRPTPLPGDVTHWLELFAQPFLSAVPDDGRPALLEEVRARLEPRIRNADGVWIVDYVRLRFAATRPG
jgi:trans-aconitate methyltransferase